MNTQPGRLLSEKEMREFRKAWPKKLPQESKATVDFEHPMTLHRVPCSCGWVGVWYASDESALNAWHRHFFREHYRGRERGTR
jgi:hypothetical protein